MSVTTCFQRLTRERKSLTALGGFGNVINAGCKNMCFFKVINGELPLRNFKMTKREVVRTVLEGKRPPYIPWHFYFTLEARKKLLEYYGGKYLDHILGNHFLGLGNDIGFFADIDNDYVQDIFGVIWGRGVDKDIGVVKGQVLPEPTLSGYCFPDPKDKRFSEDVPENIENNNQRFRIFNIGFSLYERA